MALTRHRYPSCCPVDDLCWGPSIPLFCHRFHARRAARDVEEPPATALLVAPQELLAADLMLKTPEDTVELLQESVIRGVAEAIRSTIALWIYTL